MAGKELSKPGPQVLADIKQLDADTIRKYICPSANDKEIFFFLNIAAAYGLNPFKREIHLVKYKDPNLAANIIVGYEVYLKRAEDTHQLEWWHAEMSEDGKIATCTIKRKDWTQPFIWIVERSEFDKGFATWKTMPKFMTKKVCIAQAFRLAFPKELGGMPYTAEEIAPGAETPEYKVLPDNPTTPAKQEKPEKPAATPPAATQEPANTDAVQPPAKEIETPGPTAEPAKVPPPEEKPPEDKGSTEAPPPAAADQETSPLELTEEQRQAMEQEMRGYYTQLTTLIQTKIRPTSKITVAVNELTLIKSLAAKIVRAEQILEEHKIPLPEK